MIYTKLNNSGSIALYEIDNLSENEIKLPVDTIADMIRFNYGAKWVKRDSNGGILQIYID